MKFPAFLQPEVFPYASVEIIPAPVSRVERTIEETERAHFHALITHPTTGARLDALLADNRRIDAEMAAALAIERADEDAPDADRGSTCSAACGFCGACS